MHHHAWLASDSFLISVSTSLLTPTSPGTQNPAHRRLMEVVSIWHKCRQGPDLRALEFSGLPEGEGDETFSKRFIETATVRIRSRQEEVRELTLSAAPESGRIRGKGVHRVFLCASQAGNGWGISGATAGVRSLALGFCPNSLGTLLCILVSEWEGKQVSNY